jgi:universal stress protein F
VAIVTENDVVNRLPQRKIASWVHREPVYAPNSLLTDSTSSQRVNRRRRLSATALQALLGRANTMYKQILVPIDLGNPALAKPAIATAAIMAGISAGAVRLVNVLPFVPVLVAECVSSDFDVRQRKSAEEALAIIAKESGLDAERVSLSVRKGGIHQEILEEASAIGADLIVMSSHRPRRPAMITHFLSSNAGHVVRYAKCSVLVVRN